MHGYHKTPYKASERSCALVNFTDGKLCSCQQKPALKIRGILRKDRLLSKSYQNRNAGVLGQVFSEAKSIPRPPETQPHSSPVGLTSLRVWSLLYLVRVASVKLKHGSLLSTVYPWHLAPFLTHRRCSVHPCWAKHICSRPGGRCNMCETRFLLITGWKPQPR